MTNYYYCILRKDLFPFGEHNPSYLIIQASHACFEMARKLAPPEKGEVPTSMVLLEAKDEADLFRYYRYLKFQGLIEGEDMHMFFEPDHQTGFTAICTRPFEGRQDFMSWIPLFGSPGLLQEDLV